MSNRLFFKADLTKKGVDQYNNPPKQTKEKDANLIGSLCDNGKHKPVLDIDFGASLVPSSTPGHYHLYLDKEMDSINYMNLLGTLMDVGIIEEGYFRAAQHHGGTFVRKPGLVKGSPEDELKQTQMEARQKYWEEL